MLNTGRTMRHAAYAIIGLSVLLLVAIGLFIRTVVLARAEIQQRKQAQTNESRLLASVSKKEAEMGNATSAALLALRGLPKLEEQDSSNRRPVTGEAVWALSDALHTYATSRLIWTFEGHGGQREAVSELDDVRKINKVGFSPDWRVHSQCRLRRYSAGLRCQLRSRIWLNAAFSGRF